MKGIVKMINPKRGLIAVEVDTNDFTVMKILQMTCSVEIGDVISGNLASLGGETMLNLSTKEKLTVSVESINCTPKNARDLIT